MTVEKFTKYLQIDKKAKVNFQKIWTNKLRIGNKHNNSEKNKDE